MKNSITYQDLSRMLSQYTHHRNAFGLDTDRKRFIRLFFQPVLIAWALYASTVQIKKILKINNTF